LDTSLSLDFEFIKGTSRCVPLLWDLLEEQRVTVNVS
jgi:hypothetical protein